MFLYSPFFFFFFKTDFDVLFFHHPTTTTKQNILRLIPHLTDRYHHTSCQLASSVTTTDLMQRFIHSTLPRSHYKTFNLRFTHMVDEHHNPDISHTGFLAPCKAICPKLIWERDSDHYNFNLKFEIFLM